MSREDIHISDQSSSPLLVRDSSSSSLRSPGNQQIPDPDEVTESSSESSQSVTIKFAPAEELSKTKEDEYGSVASLEPWFPKVNPDHPRAKTLRTKIARRKVVLLLCLSTVSVVCLVNYVLAGLMWFEYDNGLDGVVTLYQGDCKIVGRADTLAHLVIKILSTCLMGASNLTLQLIVAPTRKEVDRAHRSGTFLDIGVPSLHNLI